MNDKRITHGLTNSKIAGTWYGIKGRCYNKSNVNYKYYGGRGIKCKWKNFTEFYKDMGDTYQEGLSIERIDVDGDYEKENCKWATTKEQSRNKRNNIIYKGKLLIEWCEQLGIKKSTVYGRIYNGWSVEEALGIKKHKHGEKNGHLK